jgi:hypothetical protein
MLNLIEILFSRHGIQSLRFDGKMDRAARDSTLATFKKAGGPKVILIRQAFIQDKHSLLFDEFDLLLARNVAVLGT